MKSKLLLIALCAGGSAEAAMAGPGSPAEVTFNAEIGPLMHENCMSCHRPGEAGPFPLITYDQVVKKSRTIQRVLESGYMPPWHAVDTGIPFADNRQLSVEQIALFDAWVSAGMPEGEGPAPTPPSYPEGWQLGTPDLVVEMPAAYPVAADGPDLYRNFAIDLDLPEDKWVKAVELRPANREVVHHVLFFLDTTGSAVEEDGKDGLPGFRGMSLQRSGSLGGYIPGSTVRELPEGLAMALPAGADLVLSSHFHPSGRAVDEKMTVGFYFADEPPSRPLANIQLPPFFGRGMGIDIPAGESHYTVEDTFTLPVDVEAFSVGGHAHYICETMKMTARLPDGTELTLLQVDDWDLNWQDRYTFEKPVVLPAGTVLTSVLTYDNSAANPDNPFTPPQRIKWGRESTDEMGSITLMISPLDTSDERRLEVASRMKQVELLGGTLRSGGGDVLAIALERRIEALDANGDGILQSAEIPERFRAQVLKGFDRDADGTLDQSERAALLEHLRESPNLLR